MADPQHRPSADLNELLSASPAGEQQALPNSTGDDPNVGGLSKQEPEPASSSIATPPAPDTQLSASTAQGELLSSEMPVDGKLISIDDTSASISAASPAPLSAVDLLSAQAEELSVSPRKSKPEPLERPTTPPKDEPNPLEEQIKSPPPPPPPPKDVPPKDVPPKDVPPKDLPPKDVPPRIASAQEVQRERIHLEPPLTPIPSRPSSPSSSPTTGNIREKPSESSEDEAGDNTRTEIHDLFQKSHQASVTEEQLHRSSIPTSPTISTPTLATASQHPPRSSSLTLENNSDSNMPSPGASTQTPASILSRRLSIDMVPTTKQTIPHQPPPPDVELPFDFHRFLAQLRHRSADPVAKFLRSFLQEFAKKQWAVNEQVKIVQDFLYFINGKMDHCEVWREVGDGEMDNAREGMEKLVMNRLYTQTFSPEIDPPPEHGTVDERFPGRRGLHQEDVERDEVLSQKIRIYSWIREEHLDIGDTMKDDKCRQFLELAVKEMLKIGSYRAPRDKVICVLNCCKVIFGWIRYLKSEESADKFVPLLIYVVLRANPDHLVSNVQYILRFRNPDKLSGEAGYYLSSLAGAIQFIESLDRSSLTITSEEFEANVEAAVAAIAERSPPPSPPRESFSEKSRQSTDGATRISTSSRESTDPGSPQEDKTPVAGLLRSIQRPLSTIGRMFSDEPPPESASRPVGTTQPGRSPRHSPHASINSGDPLLTAIGGRRSTSRRRPEHGHDHPPHVRRYGAEEAAARQTSAEEEEARRIGRMEYENVVAILQGMFPALDGEIIGDVVRMKEGRVGQAVDACLALGGQHGFA